MLRSILVVGSGLWPSDEIIAKPLGICIFFFKFQTWLPVEHSWNKHYTFISHPLGWAYAFGFVNQMPLLQGQGIYKELSQWQVKIWGKIESLVPKSLQCYTGIQCLILSLLITLGVIWKEQYLPWVNSVMINNHTVCSPYRLASSLSNKYLRFLQVFSWPGSSFVF